MKLFNKAAFLLLATALVANFSNAQSKWSAGYQAGVGTLNVNADHAAFTNQVFINRKISHKLELEAAFGITAWKGPTYDGALITGDLYSYKTSNTTYSLTLTGKYHFIQHNKWSLYLPLAISNTYIVTHVKTLGDYNPFEWMNSTNTKTTFAYCVSSGIGGNVHLSKRFYLNAQMNVGIKTEKAFSNFDKRNAIQGNAIAYGFQTGIGYRF